MWEFSVIDQYDKKIISFTQCVHTEYIWHRRWRNSKKGNLSFWSYIATAGQEDSSSYVARITFTNRIICMLPSRHWDGYCLLSTSPIPLKWRFKLAATLLRRKRESMGEPRADTGQRSIAATGRLASDRTDRRNNRLSGSLLKPPNPPGFFSIAVKSWRAKSLNPSTQRSRAPWNGSTLF